MTGDNGFEGVWIPAELWESREVTLQEKVMLIQIKSLAKKHPERGCFKRNEAFAEFFGLSKSRVSEVISALEKKGLIKVHFQRKGKQIVERNIYLTQAYHDMVQEKVVVPPEDETPFGNGDKPLRETLRTPSGMAKESSIKSNTVESKKKRRGAHEEATPEQLNNLFSPQSPEPQSKFSIPLNWRPDRDKLEPYCMNAGCPTTSRPDQLIDGIIGDWVNYWHGDGTNKTEAQWFALLAGWLKRKLAEHDSGGSRNQTGRNKSYGVPQRNQDFESIDHREGGAELGLEVI